MPSEEWATQTVAQPMFRLSQGSQILLICTLSILTEVDLTVEINTGVIALTRIHQ